MKGARIRIVDRAPRSGKVLTGARTELWINGKKMPLVTHVTLDIAAGDIARATVEFIPSTVEFSGRVDVSKKQAKRKKKYVLGRFTSTK